MYIYILDKHDKESYIYLVWRIVCSHYYCAAPIYMYMYMYMYMYIYTHTHTHTHIYIYMIIYDHVDVIN